MKTMAALVLAMAAVACGSDDDSRGDDRGRLNTGPNPCIENPLGDACQSCARAAEECLDSGVCDDKMEAYDACYEANCSGDDDVCCLDEGFAWNACIRDRCPKAYACYVF